MGSPDDVLDQLWSAARQLRSGADVAVVLPGTETAPEAERPVARAVRAHLASVSALRSAAADSARRHADEAVALWDQVAAAVLAEVPQLTSRSNAFHMRLAARHGDFYRSLERKALLQWVQAARLKGRFLSAMARHVDGERDEALDTGIAIAADWRAGLSPRLPGLAIIEDMTGTWAGQLGRADIVARMKNHAAQRQGPDAPWPEDDPRIWLRPRTIEAVLRFGCAATPISWPGSRGLTRP